MAAEEDLMYNEYGELVLLNGGLRSPKEGSGSILSEDYDSDDYDESGDEERDDPTEGNAYGNHAFDDDVSDISDMFEEDAHLLNLNMEEGLHNEEKEEQLLSLDEVPYDRDLKWINTPVDQRPKPKISRSGNRFLKQVQAITGGNEAELEVLDRHYVGLDQLKKKHDTEERRSDRRRGKRSGRLEENLHGGSSVGGGSSSGQQPQQQIILVAGATLQEVRGTRGSGKLVVFDDDPKPSARRRRPVTIRAFSRTERGERPERLERFEHSERGERSRRDRDTERVRSRRERKDRGATEAEEQYEESTRRRNKTEKVKIKGRETSERASIMPSSRAPGGSEDNELARALAAKEFVPQGFQAQPFKEFVPQSFRPQSQPQIKEFTPRGFRPPPQSAGAYMNDPYGGGDYSGGYEHDFAAAGYEYGHGAPPSEYGYDYGYDAAGVASGGYPPVYGDAYGAQYPHHQYGGYPGRGQGRWSGGGGRGRGAPRGFHPNGVGSATGYYGKPYGVFDEAAAASSLPAAKTVNSVKAESADRASAVAVTSEANSSVTRDPSPAAGAEVTASAHIDKLDVTGSDFPAAAKLRADAPAFSPSFGKL